MRGRSDKQGFTLVEILVALTIIVVIAGCMYATFGATTRSVSLYSRQQTITREAWAFMRQLSAELRCCYGCARGPSPEVSVERGEGGEAVPGLIGVGDSSNGELLRIVTSEELPGKGEDRMGLRVVSYRVDNARHVLLRSQARVVEVSSRLGAEEADWWFVARDVSRVELRYFDGEKWHMHWDSSDAGALPKAVSARIVFENPSTGRMEFSSVAWIGSKRDAVDDEVVVSNRPL